MPSLRRALKKGNAERLFNAEVSILDVNRLLSINNREAPATSSANEHACIYLFKYWNIFSLNFIFNKIIKYETLRYLMFHTSIIEP